MIAQNDDFRIPDSLLITLNANPQQDLRRAEILTTIIEFCNINRQSVQAKPYIDELSNISNIISNEYIKANVYFYKGHMMIMTNEHDEALACLKKGLSIASSLPQDNMTLELQAKIFHSIGASFCDIHMYNDGYEYLLKALKISKKINNKYLTSKIEINIANPLNHIGRYDESIELCKKNLVNGVGLNSYKQIVYSILSHNYKGKASYDIALKYNDSAFMKSTTRYEQSLCLTDRAILYTDKGDVQEAIETYKYVLDNYRNEMFKDAEILTLCNYGYLIGLDSISDLAISYIDSAIVKAKEFDIKVLEKECYASKSELFYKHQEYKDFADNIVKYISLRNSVDSLNDLRLLENVWLTNKFKETEEHLRLEKELSDLKNEKAKTRLYMIIIALGSIIIILILAFNRRNILIKNKDTLLKNQELEKEVLNKEIEARNRELTAKALVQIQRQEILTEVADKLDTIIDDKFKTSHNIKDVINDIEKYKKSVTHEDFNYYFIKTNPDFYKRLLADFPYLTPYEQRLCAFLRLNLNTKDIATISNISPESAKVARARLRKRLNLVGTNEDLTTFLSKY